MSKKKKIGGAIILVILLIIVYFVWQKVASKQVIATYTLAKVTKGSLIKTVSGSGQVSASSQVDLVPKASGEIVRLSAVQGQIVKSGEVIAQVDASDVYKSLRDAEVNLASAKLSLQKLQQPSEALSLMQAENSLTTAQESKLKAEEDLAKTYEDGFNNVANAFLVLPEIISGVENVLYDNEITVNQDNIDYYTDNTKYYDSSVEQYRDDASDAYRKARSLYDKNFASYKATSRFSDEATIESLILQTYDTTKNIAEAIKNANNLVQFYQDKSNEHNVNVSAISNTHLSSLDGYTGTTNTHLISLLNASASIKSDKDAIVTAERSTEEKKETLANLQAGTDALDLQSQELAVQQKQNALSDLREKLADYTIRAPFDGVIADVAVKKGEAVSTATVVATLITTQSIVEVSLNEVDAASVKIGQKATLTFDAIEELTISGVVAEMDALGTVSQGVVTYTAKIALDTQDDRVKPGMTASASIITDLKSDALLVDNSAVKSVANNYYVEVPAETIADDVISSGMAVTLKNQPTQKSVTVGLSDDSVTEIDSGLNEGDVVIVKTSMASDKTTSTNGKSILQNSGASGGAPAGGFMPR
ncbi:MAG: HlyD family efflux transporter periplasmic adaptor subunit [Patescibacteria group bacterium]|jgi:HlyD family secretion protein